MENLIEEVEESGLIEGKSSKPQIIDGSKSFLNIDFGRVVIYFKGGARSGVMRIK